MMWWSPMFCFVSQLATSQFVVKWKHYGVAASFRSSLLSASLLSASLLSASLLSASKWKHYGATASSRSSLFSATSKIWTEVLYINNDSKRWDGKQVLVNDEWLETLYKPEELTVGKKLRIPYPVKRSSEVVYWNAVLVDPQSAKPVKANTKKTKGTAKRLQPKPKTPAQPKTKQPKAAKSTKLGNIISIGSEILSPEKAVTNQSGQPDSMLYQLVQQQGQIITMLSSMVSGANAFPGSVKPSEPHVPLPVPPPIPPPVPPPVPPQFPMQPPLPNTSLQQLPNSTPSTIPYSRNTSQPFTETSPFQLPPKLQPKPSPPPLPKTSDYRMSTPGPSQYFDSSDLDDVMSIVDSFSADDSDCITVNDNNPHPPRCWNRSETPLPQPHSEWDVTRFGRQSTQVFRSPSPAIQNSVPPPPFNTPPKLWSVQQVLDNNTGKDVASLRMLTTALARRAIFGKEALSPKSLSGRNNTEILDKKKLDYIKVLVRSRVPEKSKIEFEHIWTLCRASLSKCCQGLRNARKKLELA